MRIATLIAFVASLVLCASSVEAQARPSSSRPDTQSLRPYDEDMDLLKTARTLRCDFDSGFATAILQDGTRKTVSMASEFGTITYDNINRSAGTAREVSDVGGKDMIVLTTQRVLTFVEVTGFGNPVFTSIFPTLQGARPGVLVAVTSRHIAPNTSTFIAPRIMGVAQYYGTCRVPIAH